MQWRILPAARGLMHVASSLGQGKPRSLDSGKWDFGSPRTNGFRTFQCAGGNFCISRWTLHPNLCAAKLCQFHIFVSILWVLSVHDPASCNSRRHLPPPWQKAQPVRCHAAYREASHMHVTTLLWSLWKTWWVIPLKWMYMRDFHNIHIFR